MVERTLWMPEAHKIRGDEIEARMGTQEAFAAVDQGVFGGRV